MCGRYELNATPARLHGHFGDLIPGEWWRELAPVSRYNIAPSQPCLAIRYSKRDGHNVIEPLVWGFRPQWAKRAWINVRDDRLFETSAFKESARKRRALVVASGWYEWQATEGRRKQPYYIHLDDVLAFAGIWTARRLEEDEWELSFAIVTTDSAGVVAPIHDRMPLVLPAEHYAAWLDPATPQPESLLQGIPAERISAHPVSTVVNDPANETPACMEPLARSANEDHG